MSNLELSEQEIIRRNSLAELRRMGIDPYPAAEYVVTAYSDEIKSTFSDEAPRREVTIAGRIMSRRIMGKASFMELQDSHGRIQVYVSRDDLCPDENKDLYNVVFKKLLDIGDFVGIGGYVFRTQTGEISVHAATLTVLSKSLRPLPIVKMKDGVVYDAFSDPELRYRQRYVDLVVNDGVKEIFLKRTRVFNSMREFINAHGYIEVDTPVLLPIEIGASARPFVTHHNTLNMDMYLRIETELNLKRLIVGGFDRVYEVGRIFRNEGMDPSHNPEFTSVEMYQAYTDYIGMMDLIENMYRTITLNVCGTDTVTYQGTEIAIGKPWERLTMIEAVRKYAGVDYNDWATDEDARACAREKGVEVEEGKDATKGHVLIAFFDAFVEEKLIQPTIIYDYPVENSPLAKRKPNDPAFTERFEYFMYAREMGNAFSELNDPIDQRARFEAQAALKAQGDEEAQGVDEDFLNALEIGMPPTGGLGVGVDRLVMLLTSAPSIRDVLLFPTMKPNN